MEATGHACSLFKPGDEVFYAGSIARSGTNAELHLVDERIVSRKQRTLTFAHAAAMPLTSITAWELLFDRFEVGPSKPERQVRAARTFLRPPKRPPVSICTGRHSSLTG